MRVLVIGQGGREHALAKAFKSSGSTVFVLPGNAGMQSAATLVAADWRNFSAVTQFCKSHEIDFVFIGPEDPLVLGLADHLRHQNIAVVGPEAQAAQLEGSKIFAKEFMQAAGVTTAHFRVVRSVEDCLSVLTEFTAPYVLKADGLAAGKGVVICKTKEELYQAAADFFETKILGSSGEKAVLEQFSPGWELSLIIATNGKDYSELPMAQDHKRLKDYDQGPNTGGMGTVAPIQISESLRLDIKKMIIDPTLTEIQKRNWNFRGLVFFGIMVTPNGPSLLEYNCRLGDPETQVILPLIENSATEFFWNIANGKVESLKINPNLAASCVVLAAPGYPENARRGDEIRLSTQESADKYYIFSGVTQTSKKFKTSGGRVLGCVGLGSNFEQALKRSYELAQQTGFDGMQMRTDIGSKIPNAN
ncbi:MAG: phosphoribosylamine--glycine ligase [Proteobacteria bacterium]|jgi:phosphoribosylamine--glycine ligase|nr:phosphoribosylamine--glycine ligase [Pseudomonadota bacterium]